MFYDWPIWKWLNFVSQSLAIHTRRQGNNRRVKKVFFPRRVTENEDSQKNVTTKDVKQNMLFLVYRSLRLFWWVIAWSSFSTDQRGCLKRRVGRTNRNLPEIAYQVIFLLFIAMIYFSTVFDVPAQFHTPVWKMVRQESKTRRLQYNTYLIDRSP